MDQNRPGHLTILRNVVDATVSHTAIHCLQYNVPGKSCVRWENYSNGFMNTKSTIKHLTAYHACTTHVIQAQQAIPSLSSGCDRLQYACTFHSVRCSSLLHSVPLCERVRPEIQIYQLGNFLLRLWIDHLQENLLRPQRDYLGNLQIKYLGSLLRPQINFLEIYVGHRQITYAT